LFVGLADSTTTVNGAAGAATIFGAPATGDDLAYNSAGTAGSAVLAAYGENETLNAFRSNAPVTLAAGAGNATLIGGSANDLLIGASGNSLIVTGAGSDTVDFYQGNSGGSKNLAVFTSRDVLVLTGFGASAATTALAGATSTLAGVAITLSDQTKITFLGASSISGYVILSF
jgi:Ca2+-binding RTX toxin-like protein